MSYRRKTETVGALRRYQAFCRDHFELIERVGLPSLVVEDYHAFIYFLMHGALWPHAPIRFDIDDLDEEQRKAFLLLLDKYFESGFDDPGIAGLTEAELDDLERKYPTQFAWRTKWRDRWQAERN